MADDGDGVVLAVMAGAICGTAVARDEVPTRATAAQALDRLAGVDSRVPQVVLPLMLFLGVGGAATAVDPGEAVVAAHEAFAEFVAGVAQLLGVQATPSIDLLCRRAADGISVEMPWKQYPVIYYTGVVLIHLAAWGVHPRGSNGAFDGDLILMSLGLDL